MKHPLSAGFACGILCAGIVVTTGAIALGQGNPGAHPFTPTQLEWALVEFSARLAANLGTRNDVTVACGKIKPPSTIVCYVQRLPSARQVDVVTMARLTEALLDGYKKERGFAWLQIEFSMPDISLRDQGP